MWIAMRTVAPYIMKSVFARVPVPSPNMPPPIQSPIQSPILSPCTRVCTIDPGTGRCAGCGRTIEEIARWSRMTDDERRCIMSSLPDRHGPDRRATGR
jgi:predicted Fe-S protein YdhL (DUF1289 family)